MSVLIWRERRGPSAYQFKRVLYFDPAHQRVAAIAHRAMALHFALYVRETSTTPDAVLASHDPRYGGVCVSGVTLASSQTHDPGPLGHVRPSADRARQ